MAAQKTVKIYTTPTCPYCKLAKKWMTEHNIKYEEVDVSKDQKAKDYIIAKTGEIGVPQIEVGDEVIVGFDREKMEKMFLKK